MYTSRPPLSLAAALPILAETATPADMHDPMYMVVNLGVGGVAGRPGAAADGAEMKVDYVRAYALDGEEIAKRSEEHTSELQSLMRISYAVFCLKKKKKKM